MKEYTLAEFIKEIRPDGLGHIIVEDTDIPFEEVICDFCNDEIRQPDEEPAKKVVFVEDNWAACDKCRKEAEK